MLAILVYALNFVHLNFFCGPVYNCICSDIDYFFSNFDWTFEADIDLKLGNFFCPSFTSKVCLSCFLKV